MTGVTRVFDIGATMRGRTMGRLTTAGVTAALSLLCGCRAPAADEHAIAMPPTPRMPVTDTYHGVAVVDDYRWLEDWNDPKVKAWSEAENTYARSVLDPLPGRDAIGTRVRELRVDSVAYSSLSRHGNRWFALKRQPPKQQPLLVALDSTEPGAAEHAIVDPNVLDPTGGTAIDFFEVSPDGKRIAVSLSSGGSESGDVHVFDDTGKQIFETVPRVQGGTAGGDVAWAPDASGFFYTRYPHEGEVAAEDLSFYQQVYFHTLGKPASADRYEIGKGWPRVAEIRLAAHPSNGVVTASVQRGDGGPTEQFLRSRNGTWQQIATVDDQVARVFFGPGDELFLVSRKDAPHGAILKVSLADPRLAHASPVIPQSGDTIAVDFWEADASPVATSTRIIVPYQTGGPMTLRAFGLDGTPASGPTLPPISSIGEVVPAGDEVLFLSQSYVSPPAWFRFTTKDATTTRTALAPKTNVSFDDVEVVADTARSSDGTKVPYVVMRRRGATGVQPTIVTGYGGYGVNTVPEYSAVRRMLFDQGIVFVDTVIRGGSEFGQPWHEQGKLTQKQHVFDDFAAVLQQLIARGQTSPAKLAIIGGSNGGLLMGATFTQHPELLKAVVSLVGIYDMLRVERSPNGSFNVPEFGSVTDPDQFRALYAYSPYHHVRDGTQYPAILFMTGANDPRVDPMQSRKMTARLQATGTKQPVLLRTSGNTGHGIGTPLDARIAQDVDMYSFLFAQLGVMFSASPAH
jgi:prolyl oligopeptidase